jgi:hypothetical protein
MWEVTQISPTTQRQSQEESVSQGQRYQELSSQR